MKKIISIMLVCALLISTFAIPAYAKEDEVVISVKSSGGDSAGYGLSIHYSTDFWFPSLEMTVYYTPEVLEYWNVLLIDTEPTPRFDIKKEGEIHITLNWQEGIGSFGYIGGLSFNAVGEGDPQFRLEAKVYDRNGKEIPSRIAFTDEATEVVSDITWHYDEDMECLYIEGEGIMFNYGPELGPDCKAPWYELHDKAKKVVIGEGITAIGEDCFLGFDLLESIEIADSVRYIPYNFVEKNVVLRGRALGYVEEYNDMRRPYVFEPTNEMIRGDMNADGVLTSEDALAILKEAVGLTSPRHWYTADYNEDGSLDVQDALGVLKRAVGIM